MTKSLALCHDERKCWVAICTAKLSPCPVQPRCFGYQPGGPAQFLEQGVGSREGRPASGSCTLPCDLKQLCARVLMGGWTGIGEAHLARSKASWMTCARLMTGITWKGTAFELRPCGLVAPPGPGTGQSSRHPPRGWTPAEPGSFSSCSRRSSPGSSPSR